MEIIAKEDSEITQDDIEFLKENYSGVGGLLPKFMNLGQFFTPPHVAKFIMEALNIPNGAKVLEPSCGSGSFIENVSKSCEVTGLELDSTSARVASLINPLANIIVGDAFEHDKREHYDFVIGNPPFGESIEINCDIGFVTLKKQRSVWKGTSEFAFTELAIRAAKVGGYIALLLPMNFGFRQDAGAIRKFMRETCWHIATIKLPPETFQHVGTTVSTQILIMRKMPPNTALIDADKSLPDVKFYEGQQPIFMARVGDIGWDKKGRLTDKHGDSLTQLDELLDVFKDDYLTRENLYPHKPSWADRKESVEYAPFWNDECVGFLDAENYKLKEERKTALLIWNEMTLGIGEGRSWDFYWQDEIVDKFWNEKMEVRSS